MPIKGPWHGAEQTVEGPLSDLNGFLYELDGTAVPNVPAHYTCIGGVTDQPTSVWDHPFGAGRGADGYVSVGLCDANPDGSGGFLSWNNGTIVGWNIGLERYTTYETQSVPTHPDVDIETSAAGPQVTHWKIRASGPGPYGSDPGDTREPGRILVLSESFGDENVLATSPDTGSDLAAVTWDYYVVDEDIGTAADDAAYPWSDAATVLTRPTADVQSASAAVATSSGRTYGRQSVSGYWSRYVAAKAAGEKKLSLPNNVPNPAGFWITPDPAPNHLGKKRIRILACASTVDLVAPTTPALSTPDYSPVSGFPSGDSPFVVMRSGPTQSPASWAFVAPWLIGPPHIQIAPTYYPADFRYSYKYLVDAVVSDVRAGVPTTLTILPPWAYYQSDKMTGITYTIDWGDGQSSTLHDTTVTTHVYEQAMETFYITVKTQDRFGNTLAPFSVGLVTKFGAMAVEGRSFEQTFLHHQD